MPSDEGPLIGRFPAWWRGRHPRKRPGRLGHTVLRSARSGQTGVGSGPHNPLCITCSPRGLRLGEGGLRCGCHRER